MSRNQPLRGATPLTEFGAPSRQTPLLLLGCGSLLIIVGISLSPPEEVEKINEANPVEEALETRMSAVYSPEVNEAGEMDKKVESDLDIPRWQDTEVRKGDNLSLIFARAGFSDKDLFKVAQASENGSIQNIYPGEQIGFQIDGSGNLSALRHIQSPLKTTIYQLGETGFAAETITRVPDRLAQQVTLTIDSSLFIAGIDAGLKAPMIMELASIFGGVIDFVLDPRNGDAIHVLYEELFLDGVRFDDGPIIAASFTNRGKTYEAYRYTDRQGETSYFNKEGVSMRKAFLKAPLDFTRVSSNFNPKRLHPIYKTRRPHRGTDYAAPRGTPVYAAGDGRVIEAGYTRANGKYVFIQHGERFQTHYLHLHRLRVKKGARVGQGDVIGTVGSTGAATGPHLHYEFLVNGVHHNPRTVHKILPKARSLPKEELSRYREVIRQSNKQLAILRNGRQLALVE